MQPEQILPQYKNINYFNTTALYPPPGGEGSLIIFTWGVSTGAAKANIAAGIVDRKSILENRKQQEFAV